MNRQEIYRSYDIHEGIIRSPGKFEAEPIYAPYFWDLVLNGMSDEQEVIDDMNKGLEYGTLVDTFYIKLEDLEEFPELRNVHKIYVWEDSLGFVNLEEENYAN